MTQDNATISFSILIISKPEGVASIRIIIACLIIHQDIPISMIPNTTPIMGSMRVNHVYLITIATTIIIKLHTNV